MPKKAAQSKFKKASPLVEVQDLLEYLRIDVSIQLTVVDEGEDPAGALLVWMWITHRVYHDVSVN